MPGLSEERSKQGHPQHEGLGESRPLPLSAAVTSLAMLPVQLSLRPDQTRSFPRRPLPGPALWNESQVSCSSELSAQEANTCGKGGKLPHAAAGGVTSA